MRRLIMPLSPDAKVVVEKIIPELEQLFVQWSQEYKQERDLGIRGEFVGLYRKTRKLKTAIWDGASTSGWREGVRLMLLEVAAHALLAVVDFDKDRALLEAELEGDDEDDED